MDVSIRELPKDHSRVAVQYAYSMLWQQTVDWIVCEQQHNSLLQFKQRLHQVARCLRCDTCTLLQHLLQNLQSQTAAESSSQN
jgi:hypothetical protein